MRDRAVLYEFSAAGCGLVVDGVVAVRGGELRNGVQWVVCGGAISQGVVLQLVEVGAH